MQSPKARLIDLSREGENTNHFVLAFRARTDGRNSTWVCRLRIEKGDRPSPRWPYLTKSLHTTDVAIARERAFAWRRDRDMAQAHAEASKIPTFRVVSEGWLAQVERERAMAIELNEKSLGDDQYRRWRTVTRRYLQTYFGDLPINGISSKRTDAYGLWRRSYYTSGPGLLEQSIIYERGGRVVKRAPRKSTQPARSTVAKDAEVFNKIIAYALKEYDELEWLGKPALGGVTVGARPPARRERFQHDQVKLILKVAQQRAYTDSLKKRPRHAYARAILLSLIRFLWATGARTSEALVLKIGDIENTRASPQARVPAIGRLHWTFKGDWTAPDMDHPDVDWVNPMYEYEVVFPAIKHVSHARRHVPRIEFEDWFRWHGEVLASRFPTRKKGLEGFDPSLPLFPDWNGKRLSVVDDNHDSLLEACKTKKWPDGLSHINNRKMSLSSWRHTYASEMIEAFARSKKPNMIRFLAENMGTSEEMIQEYYGHLIPSFARDELRI
jgi:integrase